MKILRHLSPLCLNSVNFEVSMKPEILSNILSCPFSCVSKYLSLSNSAAKQYSLNLNKTRIQSRIENLERRKSHTNNFESKDFSQRCLWRGTLSYLLLFTVAKYCEYTFPVYPWKLFLRFRSSDNHSDEAIRKSFFSAQFLQKAIWLFPSYEGSLPGRNYLENEKCNLLSASPFYSKSHWVLNKKCRHSECFSNVLICEYKLKGFKRDGRKFETKSKIQFSKAKTKDTVRKKRLIQSFIWERGNHLRP